MKKGYIYKITNPNNQIYIGKTFNKKNRFNQYKNLNCKSQPAIYNSLLKYGFDSHSIEIIFEGELTSDKLSIKEIGFIKHYDSFHNGLNCTFGGDDGFLCGEYNVAKRKDVRDKMSKSKLKYYENNDAPMKGRKHNKETKDKIKKARAKQGQIIRCIVYDKETHQIWYSMKELAKELNINYKSFHYRIKKTDMYKNKYKIIKNGIKTN